MALLLLGLTLLQQTSLPNFTFVKELLGLTNSLRQMHCRAYMPVEHSSTLVYLILNIAAKACLVHCLAATPAKYAK